MGEEWEEFFWDVSLLTSALAGPTPDCNRATDGLLFFLFLETYVLSVVLLALLLSTFFTQAKLASACAGILYFCL